MTRAKKRKTNKTSFVCNAFPQSLSMSSSSAPRNTPKPTSTCEDGMCITRSEHCTSCKEHAQWYVIENIPQNWKELLDEAFSNMISGAWPALERMEHEMEKERGRDLQGNGVSVCTDITKRIIVSADVGLFDLEMEITRATEEGECDEDVNVRLTRCKHPEWNEIDTDKTLPRAVAYAYEHAMRDHAKYMIRIIEGKLEDKKGFRGEKTHGFEPEYTVSMDRYRKFVCPVGSRTKGAHTRRKRDEDDE